MTISLINSSIIFLIGMKILKLVKNQYAMYVYAFALLYVSFLFGFLSLIAPTAGLTYLLINLENQKAEVKSIEKCEEKTEEYNNETSDEEINTLEKNPNDTSDEETSDEEKVEKVNLEETSDEENGQNCRGCGCFVQDGKECVLPDSSKAYCSGCFEELEIKEEEEVTEEEIKEEVKEEVKGEEEVIKGEKEVKVEEEVVKGEEEVCNKTNEECVNTDCNQKCSKKRKIEFNCNLECSQGCLKECF